MARIILTGKSKKKIELIAELAENLGLNVRREHPKNDEEEEKAMINAMETGKTGEYVNSDIFLEQLKK